MRHARMVLLIALFPVLGGCAAVMSALGGVTPKEVEERTSTVRKEVEEVRSLLKTLREEVGKRDDVPQNVKDRLASLETLVDGWTGRLDDLTPKVEKIAENIAKVLSTGAGVASSVPGGQPIGAGMAILGQLALLIAAGAKGAKGGGS